MTTPFINAKGRVVQWYDNVRLNTPSDSTIVILVVNTTEAEGTLDNLVTVADLLANANTDEVTNVNYARKTLTDSVLSAPMVNNASGWVDLDCPDQLFVAIEAGDAWTDVVFAYKPAAASTDAETLLMTIHDFVATPDGRDIPMVISADGFCRSQ